ncbi:hypothetical protein D3C87_1856670 [compost metagenome]
MGVPLGRHIAQDKATQAQVSGMAVKRAFVGVTGLTGRHLLGRVVDRVFHHREARPCRCRIICLSRQPRSPICMHQQPARLDAERIGGVT